jgi:hypothetical protein
MRIVLFILFLCFCILSSAAAQNGLSVETSGIFSTSEHTPFWLQANRHGMYARNGSQAFSRIQYHAASDGTGRLNFSYGADLIARPGKESTINLNRGYVAVQAYGIEFIAGRFYNTSPIHAEDLSMGSLGISKNASPIPQVRLGLVDWTSVPFTKNFVQIKAHLTHGWLGNRRYTENLLLHEKVGHVKFGGDLPVNIYAGIAHYAKWGGNNHPQYGDIPTRLSDYVNVFFARPGDERTPGPMQNYVLGDHLGAWDFGFFLDIGETEISFYRQHPLESRDNLKLKSLQDALTGISISLPKQSGLPFNKVVYEYLYTKYQDGPRRSNEGGNLVRDLYRGNENYYNHGVYRSGWVYQNQTIGNPLFTPSDSNLGILNNRIVAHHAGISGSVRSADFSAKVTYSRNYGKYCDNRVPDLGDQEIFGYQCVNEQDGVTYLDKIVTVGGHSVTQWSFFAGLYIPIYMDNRHNVALLLESAFDNGALTGDQFGILVGLRWQPGKP